MSGSTAATEGTAACTASDPRLLGTIAFQFCREGVG